MHRVGKFPILIRIALCFVLLVCFPVLTACHVMPVVLSVALYPARMSFQGVLRNNSITKIFLYVLGKFDTLVQGDGFFEKTLSENNKRGCYIVGLGLSTITLSTSTIKEIIVVVLVNIIRAKRRPALIIDWIGLTPIFNNFPVIPYIGLSWRM